MSLWLLKKTICLGIAPSNADIKSLGTLLNWVIVQSLFLLFKKSPKANKQIS